MLVHVKITIHLAAHMYAQCSFFQGSPSALVVKWADTEKERQARKVQKAQAVSSPPMPGQQPSIFGALPMGYVPASPPYNGFSYQVTIISKFLDWDWETDDGISLEFD